MATNWGRDQINPTGTTGNWTRAMGGLFPNITGARLISASVYVDTPHSAQCRVAVYQGGDLATGPDGADLIYDFGQTSGSATSVFLTLNHPGPTFPSLSGNTNTWVAIKMAGGFQVRYGTTPATHAGDYQQARGRFNSGGEVSNTPTIAYPDPWPTDSGSFSNFWYSWYLTYVIPQFELRGITRRNSQPGTIVGGCDCFIFKDNLDNTLTFVDYTVSDSTTGEYVFSDIADSDSQYLVAAWKTIDSTSSLMDVTDHVLTPAEDATATFDLCLWSDLEKGEGPILPDTDLRLRAASDRCIGIRNHKLHTISFRDLEKVWGISLSDLETVYTLPVR